ncbi:hypothetical protein HKCCSP123_12740 [Rhodobacterales bacterium HKCCSP123]|nr:hypothetical protein [Rhodobacterales bacterium HKCCSP123]
MPPLLPLALRYLLWLIGVRFLLGLLENFAGLPPTPAMGVILAAAPMAEIAVQAGRRATCPLAFRDWAAIWGVCLGSYALLQIALPAILLPPVRALLTTPGGLQQTAVILAATGAMGALFLWIGTLAGARDRR